jgi:starch-binding outer membrane protein, SusD/RagB family
MVKKMISISNIMDTRKGVLAATLVAAALSAGCEVTNPGPVDDAFIALPAAQAGLILGSWERSNHVIGYGALDLSYPVREVFPGGQTGNYGKSIQEQAGNLGGWTASGRYNDAQQARWIAEEAVRRFTARGDVSAFNMASAMIAAGYANRFNGDYFCYGVIDGGKLEPGDNYFKYAESWFTKALAIAPDNAMKNQALAGRAQARLALGDWAGAAADAKQVPTDFVFMLDMDYSKGANLGQQNQVYYANSNTPYKAWTVRYTFFDKYYTDTGDPRTPWVTPAEAGANICTGGLSGYPGTGSVPCTQQKKYKTRDDDIRIASGAEMRLIEAEAILRQTPGNWAQAMTLINANRTRYVSDNTKVALTPWTATNVDEAWTFLMRERGIEFWLEGRRFADLRRWSRYIQQMPTDGATLKYGDQAADGTITPLAKTTPGTLDWPDFEAQMTNKTNNLFTQNLRGRPAINGQSQPRELCYNISETERANNPNLNEQGEDVTP